MPRDAKRSALPVTSTTLLDGLRDPANDTVWGEYVGRFRPLILRYAAKLGVPDDAAEDVAQATLLAFSSAYRSGRYDRERGRLSSWLFGMARNEIRTWERARSGGERLETRREPIADGELEALWDQEWRASLVAECLRLARRELDATTVAAFEAFALDGRPIEEVARQTGLTPNAIYGAKRRVLARIRELAPAVEAAW